MNTNRMLATETEKEYYQKGFDNGYSKGYREALIIVKKAIGEILEKEK